MTRGSIEGEGALTLSQFSASASYVECGGSSPSPQLVSAHRLKQRQPTFERPLSRASLSPFGHRHHHLRRILCSSRFAYPTATAVAASCPTSFHAVDSSDQWTIPTENFAKRTGESFSTSLIQWRYHARISLSPLFYLHLRQHNSHTNCYFLIATLLHEAAAIYSSALYSTMLVAVMRSQPGSDTRIE